MKQKVDIKKLNSLELNLHRPNNISDAMEFLSSINCTKWSTFKIKAVLNSTVKVLYDYFIKKEREIILNNFTTKKYPYAL
jgi:hypothetical protein